MRRTIAMLVVLVGCGPQVDADAVDESEGGGDDLGTRPTGAGAMYSACSTVSMCAPLEFCVFPDREGGYCSAACNGEDPSACAPAPGDGAEVSCLDIGVPDGRQVCALDCAHGSCPANMQCEGIETPSGESRQICF